MPKQKKEQPYKAAVLFRKEPPPPDGIRGGDYDRFGILLKRIAKIPAKQNILRYDLIPRSSRPISDWAFISKVDALLGKRREAHRPPWPANPTFEADVS